MILPEAAFKNRFVKEFANVLENRRNRTSTHPPLRINLLINNRGKKRTIVLFQKGADSLK